MLLFAAALVQVALLCPARAAHAQQVDRKFFARPGVTCAELLRARGFLAEEHFITTPDGYILKLTRGINPLFAAGRAGLAHKPPVLFLHGVLADASFFLVNSFNVQPKDLTGHDLVANASGLAREPSSRSLPFLALNFGHEVWLLSRRGTSGSQRRLGGRSNVSPGGARVPRFRFRAPKTREQPRWDTLAVAPAAMLAYGQLARLVRLSFDRSFWNYSLDEQAQFDLPQSMDYVLQQTGHARLSLVGHSAGGALVLMALSQSPELADKVASAVLWAPAFAQSNRPPGSTMRTLEQLAKAYIGPLPPSWLATQVQALLGLQCARRHTHRTTCEWLADGIFGGVSGSTTPMFPELINSGFDSVSTREFRQLAQNAHGDGFMHHWDFGREGNLRAYGAPEAPAYELERVALPTISIYGGATDALVTPGDIERTVARLKVPCKRKQVGPIFNHIGFTFHERTANLTIIPSLVDLEQSR